MLVSILERGVKMSESLVVNTKGNPGQTEGSFPVRISQAVAQEIDSIATKRQTKVEVLINEILERYIVNQSLAKRRNGTAFLLSLAGMFNSSEKRIGTMSYQGNVLVKKVRVTDDGLLIPKQLLAGVQEVEIRKDQYVIFIVPMVFEDPILQLGAYPIMDEVTDAAEQHDRYLYQL